MLLNRVVSDAIILATCKYFLDRSHHSQFFYLPSSLWDVTTPGYFSPINGQKTSIFSPTL